jgi:hypothetical protein
VQLPDNYTPYLQQWGLNLQLEPLKNLMLEVGYQGSHGLREPSAWSFNQAALPPVAGNPNNSVSFRSQCPPGTDPGTCSPIQDRVQYYNFAANATALANIFQSVHHAMTVKADKRFSYGLQMLGVFTWGRTIDQISEFGGVGGAPAERAQWSHSLSAERAVSNFDQTRRLVMSWMYELPIGKGKALLNRGGTLNRILGGWQANGIVTFADGTPFNIACGCGDRSQTGDTRSTMRMNVVGNLLPSDFQRTTTDWFNTTALAFPALGTLGNAGRNPLRSTGQRATDFSVFKNARFSDRWNMQFRAEFFNLFSGHFYSPVFPDSIATDSNFGSLLPVGGDIGNLFNPRIIQFGLRLMY